MKVRKPGDNVGFEVARVSGAVPAGGRPPVGLLVGSQHLPEQVREIAVEAEGAGFGEFWVSEDYFFHGGIADATMALSATQSMPVGIGVLSAQVRHPAVLAMELATLARSFPGRLRPGIGLGVPRWMDQMGLRPNSQLGLLRETVTVVRRLLAGEEVTAKGPNFAFDKVKLKYPVPTHLPLDMGVSGPNMLRLSGEVADGTVGSVLAGVQYIRWAREQIATGCAMGQRLEHRFTAFALYSMDHDARKAKDAMRDVLAFYLSIGAKGSQAEVYGIVEQATEIARGGQERMAHEMPDQWIEDLAIAGEPDECADKIDRLLNAGADSVILFPSGGNVIDMCRQTGREVLPRIRAAGQS